MPEFVDEYARDLLDLEDFELTSEEVTSLLLMAREVAHGTERSNAPLVSYVAGLRAGAIGLDAERRVTAAAAALDVARRHLRNPGRAGVPDEG